MKYSVKLLLYKQKSDGTHSIYIRIIINRKPKYIFTNHNIEKAFWDEKNQKVKESHPSAEIINTDIFDQKNKILADIVSTRLKGESTTSALVKQKSKEGITGNDYFAFVESYSKATATKRAGGTTENYRKHSERLKKYHLQLEGKPEDGIPDLPFEAITENYLTKYELFLRKEVGPNYTFMLLRSIRTIFNAARKRGITNHYPFKVYELPQYLPPEKDILTLAELDYLERIADGTETVQKNKKYKSKGYHRIIQTAVYFLLGAYTGLRVSDWFQFNVSKHIRNNEVLLRAGKNKEWITMPVSNRLKRNLERIKNTPLTIYEQDLRDELRVIFPKKKVMTHTARHTFAVTMCAERGVSCEACATLMGITFETCADNYYKVTPLKIKTETLQAWKDI